MKTGYNAVYAKDFCDGIGAAVKNRFDFVQFKLGVPELFLDRISIAALNDIRACAEDKGIEITFHAPGDNVSLFSDYPIIRRGILDGGYQIF